MDCLCENKDYNPPSLIVQHILTPLSLSGLASPQGIGNITAHQKLSHWCELNLGMSPHRARYLDLTGRLTESAALQAAPVPDVAVSKCSHRP
jgi:hypothetical protein